MKYLIIQEADGTEFPVFCCAPQTHAEMATAWRRSDARKVVAAGFVEFQPASGAASTFGYSNSLGLGPRPGKDAALITAMHLGTLAMAGKTVAVVAKNYMAHEFTFSPESAAEIERELKNLSASEARTFRHFGN